MSDTNDNILTAQVPIQQHGMRLDQVAAELFPDYSRNRLATWIKEGTTDPGWEESEAEGESGSRCCAQAGGG